MNLALIEAVLDAVELIPVGRVVSYGDLGELCGTSARRVGAILRDHGGDRGPELQWWRVVNASGDSPVLGEALPHWRAEGIELKPNGRGCRMAEYRADLAKLAADFEAATACTISRTVDL